MTEKKHIILPMVLFLIGVLLTMRRGKTSIPIINKATLVLGFASMVAALVIVMVTILRIRQKSAGVIAAKMLSTIAILFLLLAGGAAFYFASADAFRPNYSYRYEDRTYYYVERGVFKPYRNLYAQHGPCTMELVKAYMEYWAREDINEANAEDIVIEK